MANPEHLAIVKEGTEAIRLWHEENFKRSPGLPTFKMDLRDADLSKLNLNGANLTGFNFGGANLSGADLSGATLHKSNLAQARLDGATLSHSDLSLANLTSANLSKAKLFKANLNGSDLRGADLSDAILVEANLAEADLSKSDLTGANLSRAVFGEEQDNEIKPTDWSLAILRHANFSDAQNVDTVKGLEAKQLGGVNLKGITLPASIKIEDLESMANVSGHVKYTRNLFLSLLIACLYSWLTIWSATDAKIITNNSGLILPIVNVSLPVLTFFLFTPFIIISVFTYFLFYFQKLLERLSLAPAVFPNGKTLDEQADPWIILSFIRPFLTGIEIARRDRCLSGIIVILVWIFVPVTLLGIWQRYMVTHNLVPSFWLISLCLASTIISIFFYDLAVTTMAGVRAKLLRKSKSWVFGYIASFVYFIFFVSCSLYAKYETAPFWWQANLSREKLSGAILNDCDLQSAYLHKADFSKAELIGANFRQAKFSDTNLEGADLSFADFKGLRLSTDDINLKKATLTGTCFEDATLVGINFEGAQLAGVNFREAILAYINFKGMDLSDSILVKAYFGNEVNMVGVNLKSAVLEGAFLHDTDLREANFLATHLEGTDLTSANLEGADFRYTYFEGADMRSAHLEGVLYPSDEMIKERLKERKYINIKQVDLPDEILKGAETLGLEPFTLDPSKYYPRKYYPPLIDFNQWAKEERIIQKSEGFFLSKGRPYFVLMSTTPLEAKKPEH
ncbi:Secreted effector protein pipB2 [Gimesia panareensis]|uniref:Secreted effector protein pipB2 n=1 Tax=Gimesia panareensis TaxID=2527978 RepID=A0A518FQW7_9PLAN|nr:pentapeptide repeat-containing protein [Gimesia panareensis]QDV18746.1 Secreted effector protein pipB2 [Gimesia panareensis]